MPSRCSRRSASHGDDVKAALAAFERDRREDVEKTQHAANVSLVWFEHLARFWNYDPVKFAFGLMTRSKSITYDNLAMRAPEFVQAVTRNFAQEQTGAAACPSAMTMSPPMFQPFRLRDMDAGQSRRAVADVHVFRGRGHAR